MTFENPGKYLPKVTKKLGVGPQAKAHSVIAEAKRVIKTEYPLFDGLWVPARFKDGALIIYANSSGAMTMLRLSENTLQQSLVDYGVHRIKANLGTPKKVDEASWGDDFYTL